MINRSVVMCLCSFFFTVSAHAEISCSQVESLGNQFKSTFLEQVNKKIAGKKKRVNRRKTLHIKKMAWVTFNGCKIKARVNVKLARKVRRDAIGHIIASGVVKSFDGEKLCIKSAKIHKVNVSNTTKIGERFYRWAANKSLPKNKCFKVR